MISNHFFVLVVILVVVLDFVLDVILVLVVAVLGGVSRFVFTFSPSRVSMIMQLDRTPCRLSLVMKQISS